MPHGRLVSGLLLLLAALPPVTNAEPLSASIEGTSLVVHTPDGRRLAGQSLIGVVATGGGAGGQPDAFRIDGVRTDPNDPEIVLYTLSTRDSRTGAWQPHCTPDERGVTGGFFLSGSWDESGTHRRDARFSVTCTSGVIGKCVRYGYKPWKTAPDGRPMWDYHQACTRLLRADYCGDGRPHTRDGVRIEIIDRIGSNEDPGNGLALEAAWTSEGATCLARSRLSHWSLENIAAECPDRLHGRVGEESGCDPLRELGRGEVLLVNKSPLAERQNGP